VELFGHPRNGVLEGDLLQPFFRDAFDAIEGASQLPVYGSGGIGIVTEIHGQQRPLFERCRVVEGPKGRFQCIDNIAGAPYGGWCFAFKPARCNGLYFG